MIKLGIAALLTSLAIWSGRVEYTIETSVEAPPEFAEITISVHSKCFTDIAKLNESHDKYLNDIVAALGKENININPSYFNIYSYNARDEHNNYKTYCEGSYQKATDITYTLNNIANISDTFALIYHHTGSIFSGLSGDEKSPSTTVNVSTPYGKIAEKTKNDLYCSALSKARKQALSWCKAEFPGYRNYRITSACDTQHEHYARNKSLLESRADNKIEYAISPVTIYVTRHYEIIFDEYYEDSDDT